MRILNFNELERVVAEKIEDKMLNEVANLVRKKVNDGIRSEVYEGYTPLIYKRNYMLYNIRNHRKEVEIINNNKIQGVYYHRAFNNEGKDLSKLIILGQQGASSYADVARYNDRYIQNYISSGANDSKPFYKPRNFIKHAKDNIKKSDIINALGG